MFTRFHTFQKPLDHSRTPLSWLKITVFYLIFLACFWIACLFIFFEVCQKISSWFSSKFLVDSGFWCFQNAELIAPSDPSWRGVWRLGTFWNKPRGKISLVISNDSRKKHDVLSGWVGKKEKLWTMLITSISPKSANDHLQEYVFSRPHKLAILFFKEEELVRTRF